MRSAHILVLVLVPVALTHVARAQRVEYAGETHREVGPAPLDIDRARDASGTSWQPDTTPRFGWYGSAGYWRVSLHTNSFVGYAGSPSRDGTGELISMNWLQGVATHAIGSGDFIVRATLSAEPATMPESGYPLPLQTGGTLHAEPLVDRQQAHELVSELSFRFRRPVADTVGLDLYVAPVGEPALGPSSYPHRFTALGNPLAPLGHQWLDSTYTTFGVASAGVFTRTVKLEGSYFNGRQPDEEPWAIDLPRVPDAQSVRLTVNPTRELSAEVSYGHLGSPDWTLEDVSEQRVIGSVTWVTPLSLPASHFGLTAAAGQNNPSMGPTTYASLVEATALVRDTHTVFGRAEAVTKTGRELALPAAMNEEKFGIGSLSVGYVYDFHQLPAIVAGAGIVGTVDVIGPTLGGIYDGRTPWGGMVFVRLRPPLR
jgi:hypothetical protein